MDEQNLSFEASLPDILLGLGLWALYLAYVAKTYKNNSNTKTNLKQNHTNVVKTI
jgi:hypothetical protein